MSVWSATLLGRAPYDGIVWADDRAQVLSVDPGSPAALADIRAGDRLADARQADAAQAYYRYRAGETLRLTLLRDGRPQTASYTLVAPPPRELINRFEPLLIGLVFWAISLGAWALRPFHSITRLFFLGSQVTVGVLATGSLAATGLPWSANAFGLLLLLLAPLVLHFYARFPNPIEPRLGRILLRGAYGGAALLALGALAGPTTRALLAPLRLLFIAAALSAALALLLRRAPQARLQVRRRRHLLTAGMVVSLSPLLFGSFLPQIVAGAPLIGYLWTFPWLALLPLAYAYALRQGELGRIDLLLNRGIVYALLSVLILALYQLIFLGLRPLLEETWSWSAVGAGLALLAALLVVGLRARLQQWVDRLFYGGWYDYRTVVRSISAQLSQGQTLEQLVAQLLAVVQTMRFETAILLWPEADQLVVKGSSGLDDVRSARVPLNGALARYLRANAGFRARDQILTPLLALPSCTAAERALLEDARLEFWLPLVSRGRLRAVLVMGQRQGDELLDEEDLDILATLSAQAAVAAENVGLLEMLRARLEQVERIRDELAESQSRLAESREAERLHLAQELHDGPIQDLYGVRFQLGVIEGELQSEAALAQLASALETLQQVTSALRQTCGDLRPPTLMPFGLEMAIRSHAERVRELHPELNLQLDLMHDGQAIPERERLALFRIFQEALANVIKHAQARWVLVRMELDAAQVTLEIRDDGCGFEVPDRWIDLARRGHFGMLGVAERAGSINGALEVISAPEAGTVVRVTAALPAPAEQPAPSQTPALA